MFLLQTANLKLWSWNMGLCDTSSLILFASFYKYSMCTWDIVLPKDEYGIPYLPNGSFINYYIQIFCIFLILFVFTFVCLTDQ